MSHVTILGGVEIPTRGDVGLKEATRDPIFLLQEREIRLGDLPVEHSWDSDIERVVIRVMGREKVELSLRDYAHVYSDHVIESWRTSTVWFTREEAQAWLDSHKYRWPDGMRVFCVCAEGELARLLKLVSKKPTGVLS